ncbi:MAG TPA: hypothetical protein VKV74_12530 [Bryobacteraceae bacterium]|nr:hypothetical protein [Bryobacteraceae bacterium]
MGAQVGAIIRRNIGFASLVSVFVASLLLNVGLALNLRRPVGHIAGVTVGTDAKEIPVISTTDDAAGKLTFGDGRPAVLYIMSPTCHWCARNLDNVRALAAGIESKYRFIGLSNTQEGLAEYVRATALPFPVHAVDMGRLPDGLDARATPQLVLVGADGVVKKVWEGALSGKSQSEVEGFFHVRLPGLLPARGS